jgi:proteasome lid subunit RPN8/RPN11
MLTHAQAELPLESCGLLAGKPPDPTLITQTPTLTATHYYPLRNAAASPVEFLSDAKEMFGAIRDMRHLGTEILAVFHSHPTSEPIPSRTDLERNYSEEVMNLIVGLRECDPVMRGWWLSSKAYRAAEWELLNEG